MKLNKSQRFTAYCIMLHELTIHSWICEIASDCFGLELDNDMEFSNFKIYFPELWNNRHYKATGLSAFLWTGYTERREALLKSIKQTA